MSTAIEDSDARAALTKQIFGEDSDLSDLSDLSDSDAEAADDGHLSEPESDEDPAPRARTQDADYSTAQNDLGRIPKIKKNKRAIAEGEEDGEPRKKRKTKRALRSPSIDMDLTPEEARKKQLNDRLDAIIKKPKAKKKKRGAEEEDLGQAADEEEILKLRTLMMAATAEDITLNAAGQPALAKLRALPQVTATLQKSHLEMVALDSGILATIKDWLEPMSDRTLPALNVQRALFSVLISMNVDTASLKESHLGPVILFYSRCKRVDKAIGRTANQLITNWMRPILRRSATWRDKIVSKEDARRRDAVRDGSVAPQRYRLSSLLPGMQDSGTGRRHAAIPRPLAATYSVAPLDRTDAPANMSNNKEALERFKHFNRQLKASKAASRRL